MVEMEGVTHRFIKTNGITLHVAEQGSGPLVLLLHGFPSLWYSWRHQLSALAAAGYHAIAPDLRGYGQSDAPVGEDQYTSFQLVGDIIGLLDALDEKKVFVVGHDWGCAVGWDLCLFRPDRVKAYVAVCAPYRPRSADGDSLTQMERFLGEGFYMCRFQEPGRAERDFASVGTETTLKNFICTGFQGKMTSMIAPKDQELSSVFPPTEELPHWFTEDDLKYCTENFEKSGFSGPLNYYRNLRRSWELKAPWTNHVITTTAYLIIGDQDITLDFPGMRAFVTGPSIKHVTPNLEGTSILEGGHFIPEENPRDFNEVLISFLNKRNLVLSENGH